MNSEKTSFKNLEKKNQKDCEKKWSQRKLIINALERRKQQPQDSKKKAEVSELPSTSQTLMREKLPKKRKSKSTRKVVLKKSVKNLRLNPRKAQINQTILYVHNARKCIWRVKIGLRVIYVIDGMILFVQI